MTNYSKQLIAELSEHLDDEIISFFETNRKKHKYPVSSVIELVEHALVKTFNGKTTQADLRTAYNNEMRNRKKKKTRWLEKLEYEEKKHPKTDPHYPFARIVGLHALLEKHQWDQLYHGKTLNELIADNMNYAKEWEDRSESLFVSFPGIETQTPNRIFESLVSDTAVSLYHYISDTYDGSIENYFLPFPMDLIGYPLFAPQKVKLSVSLNEDNNLVESYTFTDDADVLETSTDLQAVGDQLNSMDQNDLKFLYCALQNLDVDFYTTRQARVKKRTLVRLLYGRPGKKHYESMEEHCHKLSKYNFSVSSKGKKKLSFNLIDTVDTSSPDEVIFTFGNLLYNGIIDNEIANIKSSNLQLLENNVSTILYQSLFKERIILSTKNASEDAELVADYSYSFFSSNIRFKNSTSKKKNMDLIEESLKEFYDKGIVVKAYERKPNHQFRIWYFPLSPDERADLNLNRYKNILPIPASDEFEDEMDSGQ